MDNNFKVIISCQVEKPLNKRLQEIADSKNLDKSDIIRLFLREGIERVEKQKKEGK